MTALFALCVLLAVPEAAEADSPDSVLVAHLEAVLAAWSTRP